MLKKLECLALRTKYFQWKTRFGLGLLVVAVGELRW